MSNTRRLAASLPLLLLLLALCPGCGVLNLQPPTPSFRSVKVTELAPSGVTASFKIDFQNPNPIDLPVNTASFKLSLGDVQVIEGQVTAGTNSTAFNGTLPAKGDLELEVPVRLGFEQLLQASKEIVKSGGNVPFDFDGSLEFASGKIPIGHPIKVPVHFSGTLPFRDAVDQAIRDPVDRADLLRDPSARKFLEAALGRKLLGGLLDR